MDGIEDGKEAISVMAKYMEEIKKRQQEIQEEIRKYEDRGEKPPKELLEEAVQLTESYTEAAVYRIMESKPEAAMLYFTMLSEFTVTVACVCEMTESIDEELKTVLETKFGVQIPNITEDVLQFIADISNGKEMPQDPLTACAFMFHLVHEILTLIYHMGKQASTAASRPIFEAFKMGAPEVIKNLNSKE